MILKNKKNIFLLAIIIVFFLFSASYLLRKPYLNSFLEEQHEWITAHSLIALENLKNYPAHKHLFRLISTYPNQVNYHITDWVIVRIMDKEGVGYYTSYPPFAIILPHLIFSLLKIKINVENIQNFNMFVHFLGSIFIFLSVYHLSIKKKFFSSTLATVAYIFNTASLWFYSATYSWDILWYQLLVINLFIMSRLLTTKKNKKLYYLFVILTMLLVYTELQSLFFIFSVVLLLFVFNHPQKFKFLKILTLSSIPPLLIYIIQNSLISGPKKFLSTIFMKFSQYSSLNLQFLNVQEQTIYLNRYKLLLIPIVVLFLIVLFLNILSKKKKINKIFNNQQIIIFLIPLLIFLIHTILMFPDVIVHEFASLTIAISLSYGIGFLISNLNYKKTLKKIFVNSLIVLSASIFIYFSLINFKIYAGEGTNSYRYDLSQEIIQNLNEDEVLFFASQDIVHPQITYFTKRNFTMVNSSSEARLILEKLGLKKGKIFTLNEWGNIVDIEKVILE